MNTESLQISNRKGKQLATKIDFPNHMKPKQFALFAHCFTCTSQLNAVRHISTALTMQGIAVVRFDFTGLGKSEGEFAQSHFEANVDDLLDVNNYVTDNYEAPQLLIGHSLGGSAALVAAKALDNIKAVVTIGSPADVQHTTRHFIDQIQNLKDGEETEVNIGGRAFTISGEFVEGFRKHNLPEIVKSLRKPLLVMHAPFDDIVDVKNAHEIYHNAMHPKSFVSLDNADHLLTKKEDSRYTGSMIAAWSQRYMVSQDTQAVDPDTHQLVGHLNLKHDKFTTSIHTKRHGILADEPSSVGGNDLGLSPFELVSAGLAACTVMTLKLYAERKEWDLKEVFSYITHSKETIDGEKVDLFSKSLDFVGDLDDAQKEKLRTIAGKCPVHKTLQTSSVIQTELK